MPISKKIMLVIIIVLVVGSIWYLESLKAHPNQGFSNAQTISLTTASDTLQSASTTASSTQPHETLQSVIAADQKAGYEPAIEIADPTGFINASSSFTLKSLIGKKVILVDFWTYSCINCIRTIPYVTAWYNKYKDQGLEIVGIHTPEFDFEKDINNVQAAATKYGINYPVVLDSNYGTWQAYGNLYWPHEYLIDIAGYIVHDHVGEGDYDATEAVIQQLLKQRNAVLGASQIVATSTVSVAPPDLSDIQSPETYFGAARNQLLANGPALTNGMQTLTIPPSLELNHLYLGGTWNFEDEYAANINADAKIAYHYNAGKVYIVASAASSPVTVEVMQDGQPISSSAAGTDVQNGKVTISASRLYNLINNPTPGAHTLQLIIDQPGLQAFTFTFG
jgi:thiol-disulfide isomerase/thioredoxin